MNAQTTDTYTDEWTIERADSSRYSQAAWGVLREGDEQYTLLGLDKEQAEYGAMILNNGGLGEHAPNDRGWLLLQMVARTECVQCGIGLFNGQTDSEGRGPECQP